MEEMTIEERALDYYNSAQRRNELYNDDLVVNRYIIPKYNCCHVPNLVHRLSFLPFLRPI